MLQYVAVSFSMLQEVAVCCSVLRFGFDQKHTGKKQIRCMCVVAVCCSEWHCVAVFGSVLQFSAYDF